MRSLPWLVTAELVLLFGRENKYLARETKFKSAVVIMGCSRRAVCFAVVPFAPNGTPSTSQARQRTLQNSPTVPSYLPDALKTWIRLCRKSISAIAPGKAATAPRLCVLLRALFASCGMYSVSSLHCSQCPDYFPECGDYTKMCECSLQHAFRRTFRFHS